MDGDHWRNSKAANPSSPLWNLFQQANCITNRIVIQSGKKEMLRQRDRGMDIKRKMQLVPVDEKKLLPKFPKWQMLSKIFTLLAPFVLCEKRRRVQGGPWGLKDVPPQLDLGETLDFVELPADAKCHLSIYLSPYLLPSSSSSHSCLPVSVVGWAQLPRWKSIKDSMNTENSSAQTLTQQCWRDVLKLLWTEWREISMTCLPSSRWKCLHSR